MHRIRRTSVRFAFVLVLLSLGARVSAAGQQPIPASASISVDASQIVGHLNPDLYGSFMELMAWDVKYGLYAEMIHDRSFEEAIDSLGLPRGWNLEPDERNDNVGAIRFEQTTETAYPATNLATRNPGHSLRITVSAPDIADTRKGLSQGSISVNRDSSYVGYLWFKVPDGPNGFKGRVTVALEEDVTGGKTYGTTRIDHISGDWKKYGFRLNSSGTDRHAKFSIVFDGIGVLWLDEASLMPADAVDGVRSDVLAKIRELKPSFVRWPGGNVAQDYHWEWGVGPRDMRPAWTNLSWSNAIEPSDFGTDEYLEFCHMIGAKPSITVNVEGNGATAEEAAHWVEYVNGPADSKYGRMRAAHGHPDPYHVVLWELGNEVYGRWVRGHADAETYARSAKRYAQAMRAVDPNIKIIAVGESSMPDAAAWNTSVIRILGKDVDYLAVHDYTTLTKNQNNRTTLMARPLEYEARYKEMHELFKQLSPDHPVTFIVNEWNLFYPSTVIQSMEGAVYATRIMNAFERSSEQVSMNSVSDLVDGWVGGIIQSSRDRVYVTPQFYAIAMYGSHLGNDRVAVKTESPVLASNGTSQSVPAVDAVASRSADGRSLFVKLSNAESANAIKARISITGAKLGERAEEDLLSARNSEIQNSFSNPGAVQPVSTVIHCERTCEIVMPPDSVAVLTFRLE